jgi:DNA (cytosine-5)-methyltransferase 1
MGDIRTTTLIIFYGNRVADIRIQGDVINTLQARMGTGGNNMPLLAEPMRVRRLTPTECERLQGFPDGWTDEQSDTQRYKQMGNAVTVNVIEWIGFRL